MEKLELGRVYVTHRTEVVGPMNANQDPKYPFIGECDGVHQSYTETGRYSTETTCKDDIDFEASAKRFGCMPIPAPVPAVIPTPAATPQKFKWHLTSYDGYAVESFDTEDAAKIARLTMEEPHRYSIYKKEA